MILDQAFSQFLTDRYQPSKDILAKLCAAADSKGRQLWPIFIRQYTCRDQLILTDKSEVPEGQRLIDDFVATDSYGKVVGAAKSLIMHHGPSMFGIDTWEHLETAFGKAVWEIGVIRNRSTEDDDWIDDKEQEPQQGWHFDSGVQALSSFWELTAKDPDGDYGGAELKDMTQQKYGAPGPRGTANVRNPPGGPVIINVSLRVS